MSRRVIASRPHDSVVPRAHVDESLRRQTYGPIVPLAPEPWHRRWNRRAALAGLFCALLAIGIIGQHLFDHFTLVNPGFGQ